MSMAARSMVLGHYPTGRLHIKPCSRLKTTSWDSIPNLLFSKQKTRSVLCSNYKTQRKSFVVYANGETGAPVPSGPPSSNPMSWILGLVVSFVLPFFTNKWGPLWVIKERIGKAIQTVEEIAEAVEKVAEKVDEIAEDISDDLPAGKLKNLVDLVEDMAEKTAKTADSLDNVIDKVQEAEDQLDDVVESLAKQGKKSSKEGQNP